MEIKTRRNGQRGGEGERNSSAVPKKNATEGKTKKEVGKKGGGEYRKKGN